VDEQVNVGGDMPQRIHKPTPTNGRVEFKVSQDRFLETSVDEVLAISQILIAMLGLREMGVEGLNIRTLTALAENLDIVVGFMSKFVWADGAYQDPEIARPLLGKLSLRQVYEGLVGITNTMTEIAVPNTNGADLEMPS
jgi:hypothetical protein